MTTDTGRNRVVLFGGATSALGFSELGDTWEWDGTNWIERHPLHSPPSRKDYAMAYDSDRRRTVLFGGTDADPHVGNKVYTDTWEWDGEDWTERASPITPALDANHPSPPRMVYDVARRQTLLVGMNEQKIETWAWDGTEWRLETVSDGPKRKHDWALGYDAARQETVLVTTDSNKSWYSWIYNPPETLNGTGQRGYMDAPASVAAYGTGLAGRDGIVPRLGTGGGAPYLGNEHFRIELTQALGGTYCFILGAFAPDDTIIDGMRIYVDSRAPVRWEFLTSGTPGVSGVGTATLQIAIPNHASLLGFTTYWQGFVWDPGSPLPNGACYTHGLRVTVVK